MSGATFALLDRNADQRRTAEYLDSLAQDQTKNVQEDSSLAARVLAGKRIYIADSCELGKDGLGVYQSGIKQAGGRLLFATTAKDKLRALQKADYVVVNYREGWEFWKVRFL